VRNGRKVNYLRSDNGLEYRVPEFLDFCKAEGIARHFTVKETPQQNGVAEKMNRTMLKNVRSMRLKC
jgi:transposase InsO family protein